MGDLMDPNIKRSWENFLNPESLRYALIEAALYIAGFEYLKERVINRVRDFYCTGFDENGDIIDPKYEAEVLGANKSPLYASLLWHRKRDVIDDEDLEIFERLKRCRNQLSHELMELVGGSQISVDVGAHFEMLSTLLYKIELWWIREVEMPTNPDLDNVEVSDEEITPGPVILLELMRHIALSKDGTADWYFDAFKKMTEGKGNDA
jgi:hypothetical protein